MIYDLPRFPGLDKRTDSERLALVSIIQSAGYDPAAVAAVMQLESGISTSIRGPKVFSMAPGYPVGLIQFSPDTAKALGTSTEALERMTWDEQLRFVVAYYDRFGGPAVFQAPGDYYLAGWGASPRTPDERQLSTAGKAAYDANKGLDTDNDGVITAAELRALIDRTIANALARGTWPVNTKLESVRVPSTRNGLTGTVVAAVIGAAALLLFIATVRPRRRRVAA